MQHWTLHEQTVQWMSCRIGSSAAIMRSLSEKVPVRAALRNIAPAHGLHRPTLNPQQRNSRTEQDWAAIEQLRTCCST